MKKKELIEIIRFAVRAEVKELMPKIIKECIGKSTTKKVRPAKSVSTDPVELTKQILKSQPTTEAEIPQYTKNQALNEALAATAGGIPHEGSRVMAGTPSVEPSTTDFQGNEVDVSQLRDDVASALTKDYSQLMNAIDKKKGGG